MLYIYIYIYIGENLTPWTVHIFRLIEDTTKSKLILSQAFVSILSYQLFQGEPLTVNGTVSNLQLSKLSAYYDQIDIF